MSETFNFSLSKCLVVIPVYNCERQIPRVIKNLASLKLGSNFQILVIDNASSDSTAETLSFTYRHSSLDLPFGELMTNKKNINLGGSLKSGFIYALENDFDYVMVLHGDDQANPQDLIDCLKDQSQKFDLLIGSRFLKSSNLQGYSKLRWLGNRTLNLYGRLATRFNISDLIAGLNIYNVSILKNCRFLEFPDDLTFDAHLLLDAIHERYQLRYFPISWVESDQVSNAKVFSQGWIILKLFTKYLFGRIKFENQTRNDSNYRQYLKIVLS